MQPPEQDNDKTVRLPQLIKHPHQFLSTQKWQRYHHAPASHDSHNTEEPLDIASLPTHIMPIIETPSSPAAGDHTSAYAYDPDADIPEELLDVTSMNTMRLMQLSGMMRAVRIPSTPSGNVATGTEAHAQVMTMPTQPLQYERSISAGLSMEQEYSAPHVPRTPPTGALPYTPQPAQTSVKPVPAWKCILDMPLVRTALGLLVGVGILLLLSRFVDIPATLKILGERLSTPSGIMDALGAATFFITAFSIRGVRWSFFLRPIQKVSPLKTIQIFWVAVFMNFLLPVQGGELVKSLLLKRTTGIPISKSLPTVAMDRALDLMPALIIMAVVPFLPGIHMNLALWTILILVSSILLGVISVVALMAWNRSIAIMLIQMFLKLLPKGIGSKIEGFALGFVDSLLAGASNPKAFIPAVLLTIVAVTCDGLFAWMSFLTVGLSTMSFGTAIFGYTTYNMFSILPTPPGQLGSNEGTGVIVFSQLLGFNRTNVLAMFVFSHPLAAIIMTTMCFISLRLLGMTFASILKKPEHDEAKDKENAPAQRQPSRPLLPPLPQTQPVAYAPSMPPTPYSSAARSSGINYPPYSGSSGYANQQSYQVRSTTLSGQLPPRR